MGERIEKVRPVAGTTTRQRASASDSSEEARAFLQARVARYGLVAGGGGLAFALFRIVGMLMVGKFEHLFQLDMTAHLAAALLMMSMWVLCRKGERSIPATRTIESVALMAGSVAYQVMGTSMTLSVRPETTVLLALTFGLVARAVYVPSSARRTIWLGVAIGVPLLITTYLAYVRIDPLAFPPGTFGMATPTPSRIAFAVMLNTAMWWLLSVLLCGLAAGVVHGLREDVRSHRKLGQYELQEKLGEGGMGSVYRASHAMLRRPTAIKLLQPSKAGDRALERFEREVQLTALLTHPNTIRIYDYGRTPDGLFYYAMELLDGATLEELVASDGPQHAGRVVSILKQAAGALAEAHGLGLIHRDIKPANLILLEQGGLPDVLKVLDFGLVKELEAEPSAALTQANVITGTPQYLAPEALVRPDDIDGRSDLYALAAVGYFLLTGQHVFEGETVVEVCSKHLHTEPMPPSERLGSAVPTALEKLLLRCLAKDPDERPATADVLLDELDKCADVPTWSLSDARRWWTMHAEPIRALRASHAKTVSGLTLAIDLAPRLA